jgi:hypothetical protein
MSIDPLVDGAIIGATVLAGVGLILTYSSIRGNRSTIEASMVENIFRDIRSLEGERRKIGVDDMEAKKDWAILFFSTLDWLGFLIINGKIKDGKYVEYFKDGILEWRKDLFLDPNYIDQNLVENPLEFSDFKELVRRYKNNMY